MQALLNAAEGWFQMDIGEAGLYTVIGFVFVFLGITVLVLVFTLMGMIMKRLPAQKQDAPRTPSVKQQSEPTPAVQGQVDPVTLAVIMAAVAAYEQESRSGCEFVVRRIKKL